MPSWLPEQRVRLPAAQQRWETLTFVHFGFRPRDLEPLLPTGLHLDTFDDLAWVGITPFRMHAAVLPLVPGPRVACVESNVRAYVRDRQGRDGIWFLSLDIDELVVAAGLRASVGLPYRWAAGTVRDESPDRVTYAIRRRRPHRPGRLRTTVEVGRAVSSPGPFETYLVGRWRAFATPFGRLISTPVEHPPWPLRDARIIDWRTDGYLSSLGLPEPVTGPRVHHASGVEVRIGFPRR